MWSRLLRKLANRYHKMRNQLGLRLHAFVKSEEEEAERLRRRLHIHLVLLSASGLLTTMSVISPLNATTLIGASAAVNGLQEVVDYIGRY